MKNLALSLGLILAIGISTFSILGVNSIKKEYYKKGVQAGSSFTYWNSALPTDQKIDSMYVHRTGLFIDVKTFK